MDIEALSKAQLILLTLLVSFVTSIATGIVTVSLLDEQSPGGVTQTVHKVVERTVERIVPKEQGAAAGETIVKEVTTVVKENDLITESIAQNSGRLVRIYTGAGTSTKALGAFVGLGVFARNDGLIATDRAILLPAGVYSGLFANGTIRPLEYVNQRAAVPVALLKSTNTPQGLVGAPTLASDEAARLGQTVIALSGGKRDSVATGVIAELVHEEVTLPVGEDEADESAVTQRLGTIATNIDTETIIAGSPLINIFGEVVGIAPKKHLHLSHATYLPANAISRALVAYDAAGSASTTPAQ